MEYESLADLRGALSSDNASERSEAYKTVLEVGIEPEAVMGREPPAEHLRAEGIIPDTGPALPKASEARQEMLELLREIRDNTAGGS